ncbi:spore germination protein [Paenibacillus sp. R14(2021)]|uniref:spore germination protein n=1 Tax=Paenibacillus sp. R14(2021) TaxID=2859228 RepID=UPI001C61322E|nr:spore germination protein [Paenibacillus sp. R14(2021)]
MLFSVVSDNVTGILNELGSSPDIIVRNFIYACPNPVNASLIFLEGISDIQSVSENVLWTLLGETRNNGQKAASQSENGQAPHQSEPQPGDSPSNGTIPVSSQMLQAWSEMKNKLTLGSIFELKQFDEVIASLLAGNSILLLDGVPLALSCCTKGGQMRDIQEASTQVVIRGPKDSFTESLCTNIALVRRRIRNKQLWLEEISMGSVTNTSVILMYMKDVAKEEVVAEVKRRLAENTLESVLESGYIEEVLEDPSYSPFPTVYNTERPDVVAGNLLEGRIALLIDGTPFALIVPTVLAQFFTSAEDYYQRYDIGIFLRLLRYTSFVIALLGPSFYVGLITFHQEMIPTSLLISLAGSRESVPFPALVEALVMEICFEILREAGIRLPRTVGQAVSIVGALVLGEAAVQAGIVSHFMVIVVAVTGIASFSTPSYSLAISARLLRFSFVLLAGFLGFYGISLGIIVLVIHLNSLRSIGEHFLAPFTPFKLKQHKDILVRLPFNKRKHLKGESSFAGFNQPKQRGKLS